uniref:Uncharacterized protein n=1 Tax=Aegilops tauschii subsp. strangulata TaxID=200361 RepID=A0A453B7Z2_AEGTS
ENWLTSFSNPVSLLSRPLISSPPLSAAASSLPPSPPFSTRRAVAVLLPVPPVRHRPIPPVRHRPIPPESRLGPTELTCERAGRLLLRLRAGWPTRCTAPGRFDPGTPRPIPDIIWPNSHPLLFESIYFSREISSEPLTNLGAPSGIAGTRRARTRSSCGSTRCMAILTRRSMGCTRGFAC